MSMRAASSSSRSRESAASAQHSTPTRARTVYKGRLVTVRQVPVKLPNGQRAIFDIVLHQDAVAIVAVRYEQGHGPAAAAVPLVALVQVNRPAIGRQCLEIPAGLVDPEEQEHPEHTAARELREETGYVAAELKRLTCVYTSPGFTNEAITIYLASGLEPAPDHPELDVSEIEGLRWMPLSEALDLVRDGTIDDSKSVLGLVMTQQILHQVG
jgi:ADP-ribose pyrophosphatase